MKRKLIKGIRSVLAIVLVIYLIIPFSIIFDCIDNSKYNIFNMDVMAAEEETKGEAKEESLNYVVDSQVNKEYGEYKGSNGVYPLYRGYFGYPSEKTSKNYAATFFYSDGYFDLEPSKYNEHLATMSLNLAMSAFGKNNEGDKSYMNKFAYVKQLLSDIGCEDDDIYVNDDFMIKPEFYGSNNERLSTIGVAIAQKQISISGEDYTLVPIAIRGAGYGKEWGSNMLLGETGEAKGFADAANQTLQCVNQYINDYGLASKVKKGKVKFWVVGYSRAGATANLTAKRLTDTYGNNNQIYGYCFEAPQGGTDEAALKKKWTNNGMYSNIHNVINHSDFVTLLGPSQMGLKRYGVDHYIPGSKTINKQIEENVTDENGGKVTKYIDNNIEDVKTASKTESEYYKQRKEMLKQLTAITPDIKLEDANKEKEILKSIEKDYELATYMRKTVSNLQKYSFCNDKISNYREFYSKCRIWDIDWEKEGINKEDAAYFVSNMTTEEALVVLMNFIFCKSNKDLDNIGEIIGTNFKNIKVISFNGLSYTDLVTNYLGKWHNLSASKKVELGTKFIDALIKPLEEGGKTIWDYMTKEEEAEIRKALPVLLDAIFTYLSQMWDGKITDFLSFITSIKDNFSSLIVAHYPEVNLAWLRSYDDMYKKENQGYKFQAQKPQVAEVEFDGAKNIITVNAINGSATYYSIDGGDNWQLYRRPTTIDKSVSSIIIYTMSYGLKSDEKTVNLNRAKEKSFKLNADTSVSKEMCNEENRMGIGALCVLGGGFMLNLIRRAKKKRNIS